MRITAIVNPASGSVPSDGPDILDAKIRELGHSSDVHLCGPEQFDKICEIIESSVSDRTVLWGGDGTIAHVLNVCSSDIPLVLLPGGTMNLLVQRIHGANNDWEDILSRALMSDQPEWISALEVGSERFYVGALVGKAAAIARSREHLRDGDLTAAITTTMRHDVFDLESKLTIQTGTTEKPATGVAVFVPEVSGDAIDVLSVAPDTLGDVFEIGLSSLFNGWKNVPDIEHIKCRSISLAGAGVDKIEATLDGEPNRLSLPAHFKLIERANLVWSARET